VEVKYENKRLQELFSDHSKLVKKLGMNMTRAIKKRTNEIKASVSFQQWLDTRLGNPHQLVGDLRDYYGVSLTSNVRLILRPEANDHSPESLSKCITVVVKGVCDYHGDKTDWTIS